MSINKEKFIDREGFDNIYLYTLTNANGMMAKITNFGGIVVSLFVPDKDGKLDDVVLGYDELQSYLKNDYYLGCIIGRHANRIEDSRFEINSIEYNLVKNDGNNHLHGGNAGFHKVIWKEETVKNGSIEGLKLSYMSKDGEENYPGNMDVTVTYELNNDNSLVIDYYGVCDKDSVANLTNHSYFNLSGHESGDILEHQLMINADSFTPIDEYGIPTGEIREVTGTPMDFKEMKCIGTCIGMGDQQLINGKGYDHNWVLNCKGISEKAAEVFDPVSGRRMEVYTTKPGIQFYSGNYLADSVKGKAGVQYKKRSGLCLETQYFPNGLKHKNFPSPILKAGCEYKHTTIYKFV